MDPNQNQEFDHSPKQGDLSKMSEVEREAQFRRKRQQYVAQKMKRKKELVKQKRQQFGSSSSDQSDEDIAGSRSSKSSVKKQQPKQPQQKVISQSTPKKLPVEQKQQIQITPKKMSQSLQRIPIFTPSKRGGDWGKDVLVIGEKSIIIQNTTLQIKNFSKIKIIAEVVLGSPYKIKINCSQDQQVLLAVNSNEQKLGLPSHYYVFAKLIQEKLVSSGVKLKQNVQQKISGVTQALVAGSIIYGKINKKSQVLGNWQQRLVVINKEGIFSYKKTNQKHSMYIPNGTINQMWTRLQIQDNLLIVKIWYSGKKTQFGFPLTDFLSIKNWLYGFYAMMGRVK